ncbi:ABC transporter ATP-binding protein [Acidilobus sp.]|uniref:ABC transporter ATP-binding protein n=1 Tax=Acidilobus sp. TaxID=1872109 RepID=UPI003CFEE936
MVSVAVKNLSYEINGAHILKDISFTHGSGLLMIIGPNGAGKTTLLRALAGLIKFRGSVELDGVRPEEYRRYISYVPAQPSLDPMARGLDVALAMNYSPPDGLWKKRFLEVLGRFGLEGLANRPVISMSSGEQRLLLLAAALSRGPRLLILDEPTAFLDVTNRTKVIELLQELTEDGVSAVVATHDIEYTAVADNVAVLKSGRLVSFGSPREALSEELLSDVYGISIRRVNGNTPSYMPELLLKRFSK